MKKIAFLMASATTGELSGELERRENILRTIADPDTRIDIFGLEEDPERSHLGTIQSSYEASLSTVEDLECAIEAEKAGYDAVIIPCGGDPGVAPLREVLRVPVVPPGSTAKHLCSLIAPRFSVLTTGGGGVVRIMIHERDGLLKHVSTHRVGLGVPEVREKPEEAYDALVREGRVAVEEYGAGAVTFGCMAMNDHADRLRRELEETHPGVIVIHPGEAVIKLAELIVDMGLTHSKRSYPPPPKDVVFPF